MFSMFQRAAWLIVSEPKIEAGPQARTWKAGLTFLHNRIAVHERLADVTPVKWDTTQFREKESAANIRKEDGGGKAGQREWRGEGKDRETDRQDGKGH